MESFGDGAIRCCVRQDAAEIGDGPHPTAPAFLWNQMAHVCPSVERLHETREVHRRVRPTEFTHVLSHPDLESLRRHCLDMANHVTPAWVSLDQLARNV